MTDAFSRPILVEELPAGERLEKHIEAEAQELPGLARRLGVPSLAALAADFTLLRRNGERVTVEGEIRARLARICVVSLEPFEMDVCEPVEVEFAPAAESEAEALREAHEPRPGQTIADVPDPPDPIADGRIDLGAIAEEFLSLGLDPYPRKPGVEFQSPAADRTSAESPFEALGRLGFDKSE